MIDFKSLQFFDTAAVTKYVDRWTRSVLSKLGAFIRTTARNSIRKGKGSSPPGQPPKSHTGSLRNRIYFAFDPRAKSVVIGPTRFGRGQGAGALEHGGTSRIAGSSKRGRYAKRPYMGPAMRKELRNLGKIKASVR